MTATAGARQASDRSRQPELCFPFFLAWWVRGFSLLLSRDIPLNLICDHERSMAVPASEEIARPGYLASPCIADIKEKATGGFRVPASCLSRLILVCSQNTPEARCHIVSLLRGSLREVRRDSSSLEPSGEWSSHGLIPARWRETARDAMEKACLGVQVGQKRPRED